MLIHKVFALFAAGLCIALMSLGCASTGNQMEAQTGDYTWGGGKLSFSTDHTVPEVHEATLEAMNRLQLRVIQDNTDLMSGTIKGLTPKGDSVTVDIEPEGSYVTQVQVRVGFWGNRAQSEKVADNIQSSL